MTKEIKPCPFCGDDGSTGNLQIGQEWSTDNGSCVYCNNCDTAGPIKKTDEQALKAWNTRA